MRTTPSPILPCLMILAVALAGCGQPSTPLASATPLPTASLTLTPPPTATPTNTPTATPIPPTPTPTPDLTATAVACKPAAQVTAATALNAAQLKPGETFTHTWRLTSSGNCAWEQNSGLVFQSGEKFGVTAPITLSAVEVGKSVEISVTLKAPQQAGVYAGEWALQRPSGQVVVTSTVRVNVIAPTPMPVVATAAPQPVANAPVGNIPPIGTGPFSADEVASGPWNCVGINYAGARVGWIGDFYIGVSGGPGNYTITDPEHCRWDSGQQKFVCRYQAASNMSITVWVSCPGCKPMQVVIRGFANDSSGAAGNVCRPQSYILATPSPMPAAFATPIPPPGQPAAPHYPKSPITPWNRDAFIAALKASRDAVAAFRVEFVDIAAGKMGNCGVFFWKYYSQWELQPGFSGVPANWYPLYYQYRVSLENVRAATWPISEICLKKGGTIPEETDRLILATTQTAIDALEQLYNQAQAMK